MHSVPKTLPEGANKFSMNVELVVSPNNSPHNSPVIKKTPLPSSPTAETTPAVEEVMASSVSNPPTEKDSLDLEGIFRFFDVKSADFAGKNLQGTEEAKDKVAPRATKAAYRDNILFQMLCGKSPHERGLSAGEGREDIVYFLNGMIEHNSKKGIDGEREFINKGFIKEFLTKAETFLLANYDVTLQEDGSYKLDDSNHVQADTDGKDLVNHFQEVRRKQLERSRDFWNNFHGEENKDVPAAIKETLEKIMRSVYFVQCVKSMGGADSYNDMNFIQRFCPNGKINVNNIPDDLLDQMHLPLQERLGNPLWDDFEKFVILSSLERQYSHGVGEIGKILNIFSTSDEHDNQEISDKEKELGKRYLELDRHTEALEEKISQIKNKHIPPENKFDNLKRKREDSHLSKKDFLEV